MFDINTTPTLLLLYIWRTILNAKNICFNLKLNIVIILQDNMAQKRILVNAILLQSISRVFEAKHQNILDAF